MAKRVRTRFAPSPTGFLHIGGLRTALYAYLFAKKYDGDFILRIEDTDVERTVPGAVDVIYSTLAEAHLNPDEGPKEGGAYGPYIQTQRKDIYLKYAHELVEKGAAYYCFCTKERLASLKDTNGVARYDKHCLHLSKEEIEANLAAGMPYVIRQNMPTEGTAEYDDAVFGHISIPNNELEDQILIKSDGLPTYNFANVVDDHLMEISHVIRGNEYLSSTPKYNYLYDAFGWERPEYIHVTPIMKDATRKLSKRYGDANFDDFVKKGYLPEASVNYIALVGWSPKGTEEKFTIPELVERFGVDGLQKSASIFDETKMAWLNGEYLKELSLDDFVAKAKPFFEEAGVTDLETMKKWSALLQSRVEILSEIKDKMAFIHEFNPIDSSKYYSKRFKCEPLQAKEYLGEIIPLFEGLKDWNIDSINGIINAFSADKAIKSGLTYSILRTALTHADVTPGGFSELADILGQEESLKRLKESYSQIQ